MWQDDVKLSPGFVTGHRVINVPAGNSLSSLFLTGKRFMCFEGALSTRPRV